MNQTFIYALEIMGKGMLSIFTVILLLTFIVVLLGKLASHTKRTEEE
jgi:Na+-transporting methylmalonyl-CoA/oxaloacetate decarboxylase gamma subunit